MPILIPETSSSSNITAPLASSTQPFVATLPAVLNANYTWRYPQHTTSTIVNFRAILVRCDLTQSAAARTITYIGINGDTYTYVVVANGSMPVLGWGIVSIGAAITIDDLQVGI